MELADDDFRRYYHMNRGTLTALKTFLNPTTRTYQGGRVQVSGHKMVGMTMFFLGSTLPYFILAGIFGISEECFICCTDYIMSLLNDKCNEVIKWLQKHEYHSIADNFDKKRKRQFPNIIGAIDGCHIRISPSKKEVQGYQNFKQFHSIHLQVICLYDRKFMDIFVG